MLDVCSASTQKSLQGLDNVTAEGTEAIDSLADVVRALGDNGVDRFWQKLIENQLKEAKRYLKTDFKTHIEREAQCADHCSVHALSDPKKVEYRVNAYTLIKLIVTVVVKSIIACKALRRKFKALRWMKNSEADSTLILTNALQQFACGKLTC